MDVLITPGAVREISALRIFRPKPGTWGVLIGHKRGSRIIVEKVMPAGNPDTFPDETLLDRLDEVWPGRTVGLVAVRPGAAFRKSVRGPAWFGKVILELGGTAKAPSLRPFTVDYGRTFFLSPIRLATAPKEDAHE
jgi:hypothetical protein